ncbi:MAG: hypothetical protein ACI81T_004721, partial [Bacteroidia bacterium]
EGEGELYGEFFEGGVVGVNGFLKTNY